jgi:HAMP domain-containing protein
MVVFCEECGKKYKVDDSMIVGKKARCKCMSCGHIIEVKKEEAPEPRETPPNMMSPSAATPREQSMDQGPIPFASRTEVKNTRVGLSIVAMLLINFLVYAALQGAVLTFVYMKYVPTLLLEQVNLRTSAISKTLSTSVSQPLLLRNYLLINRTAESISQLPGVAYVAVLNKKGIIVSGIFGDVQRFSPEFSTKVKESGFPKEVVAYNPISPGSKESAKDFVLGGKKIHDVAQTIEAVGGVVHVGLFAEDVEIAVKRSPKPLLIILSALVILGSLFFILLARTISTPIKILTEAAHRISLGELDLRIDTSKGGELGELANSLDRMRFSIKSAMDRLRRR